MAGNLLKSQEVCRSLINSNVHQFIFLFFLGILFHPPCYLKRAMFRLESYDEFSRFSLGGQLYRLEDTKHNVLDLADLRNQVHQRKLLKG